MFEKWLIGICRLPINIKNVLIDSTINLFRDLSYLGGFYMTAQVGISCIVSTWLIFFAFVFFWYAPVSRILITTQYNNSKRIDWYAQKEEAVSPVWPCSKTIPRHNGEIRFSDGTILKVAWHRSMTPTTIWLLRSFWKYVFRDQQNYYLEARKRDGAFFLFRYVAVGSQLPCGWRNVQSVLHLYGVPGMWVRKSTLLTSDSTSNSLPHTANFRLEISVYIKSR